MVRKTLVKTLAILDRSYPTHPMHEAFVHTPWQFLIAVILSARARDSVVIPTAQKLFVTAPTPQALAALPLATIQSIIRPIGTYRVKASHIQQTAQILVKLFAGQVPQTQTELESLPGVGRKTANIMRSVLFGFSAIAVDTHVHRIANRVGWVATKNRQDTEKTLCAIVPKSLQRIVNRVCVLHGQTYCLPAHPRCSACPIADYCQKVILPK